MGRRRPDLITFRIESRDEVVATMEELAPAGGWLTLQPGFDGEDEAPAAPGGGLFTSRRLVTPVCSWVPGERTRQGVDHVALGVQHGAGAKIAGTLHDRGVPVPDRWVVMQDNPRRGLVVAVPPADAHADVLDWLLRAGVVVSYVALTGEWRALVYRR